MKSNLLSFLIRNLHLKKLKIFDIIYISEMINNHFLKKQKLEMIISTDLKERLILNQCRDMIFIIRVCNLLGN